VIDGKYRIDGFLGAGGMATVFRGHDVMLERPVAIKVLHAGDVELLRSEARAMARLRHENVVHVFSFGVHRELGFIAMELIEGTNLQDMIDRQILIPPVAAIGILEKIAAGLDAAHAEGIIHHDVKPANVLVGPRYRVCVTDFGLTDVVTNRDSLNGTPAYMAPERFLDAPRDQAHLSDQYSLGVTAYEMLTGRLPFECETLADLIRSQMEERPPPMATADVSRGAESVVMRALAKNPAERFPSCSGFVAALKHAATATTAERTGPGILIVDDDPSLVALFTAVIADAVPNARIASANDGLVALEIVRAAAPALILLDLQMPRLGGMEFLHQLQGENDIKAARIVAISSLLGKERPVKGGVHIGVMLRTLGVAEQLGKPVDPRQLVEVVKRQLAQSAKEP
jgi:serine/threonine-protein kinase